MRKLIIIGTMSIFLTTHIANAGSTVTNDVYFNCIKAQSEAWCFVGKKAAPPADMLGKICLKEREAVRKKIVCRALQNDDVTVEQAVKTANEHVNKMLADLTDAYREICLR